MKERKDVTPLAAQDPLVGHWLAYMDLLRERTLEAVEGLDEAALEHSTREQPNSVGSLLYHIALIELDWLYCEILEQDYPAYAREQFPHDVREASGRLTQVTGWPLARYVALLEAVRKDYTEQLSSFSADDFLRPRELPDYIVTPEWVCWHLLEHEAGHQGQIKTLLRSLETA